MYALCNCPARCICKYLIPTPQRTQFVFLTKFNQLMSYREVINFCVKIKWDVLINCV